MVSKREEKKAVEEETEQTNADTQKQRRGGNKMYKKGQKVKAFGFEFNVLAENKTHIFGRIKKGGRIYEIPKKKIGK